MAKKRRKKYRIRKLSPLWWAKIAGMAVLTVAGACGWIVILAWMSV